ncbi:MAG: DUF2185 domain-containing protein [Bacteroidales bacterium]
MKKQNIKHNTNHAEESSLELCLVSNLITLEGKKVGYMYREEIQEDSENDSGWRFLAGTESEEYVADEKNSKVFEVETIVDFDPDILPYLNYPEGSELERIEGSNQFQNVEY